MKEIQGPQPGARSGRRGLMAGIGLVAGGLVAGAILAGTLSAGAQNATTTDDPAPSTATAPDRGHGSGHAGETLLTGTTAEKVRSAALAAVPGATIDRVETDAEGSPYEAHMTKADGSRVTVKVDNNLKVTSIEDH